MSIPPGDRAVAPLRVQQQAQDAQLREAKRARGRNNSVVNGCAGRSTSVFHAACCKTIFGAYVTLIAVIVFVGWVERSDTINAAALCRQLSFGFFAFVFSSRYRLAPFSRVVC